jgi:hypothetical protein
MNDRKSKNPTCLYIGAGCAILLVIALVAVGVLVFWAKQKIEAFEDPAHRAEQVGEILGVETLPEGYYPVLGFKIPWVMDFAMISDEPPRDDGELAEDGDRLFIYTKILIKSEKDLRELKDFLEGRTDDPRGLKDANIQLDVEEIIGRGRLRLERFDVLYAATLGEVRAEDRGGRGITTLMLFECPGDPKMRLGVWLGPEVLPAEAVPAETQPAEEAAAPDYTGTAADEGAIANFVSSFRICPS